MVRFSVHYFLLFTVMATVYPYFQLFLRARGFSESELGYLQGFLALAGICGPMLMGYAADRLRAHRQLVTVGLGAFGVLVLGLSGTHGFWPAAALVIGIGLVLRPTIPLTDTLAATALPDPVHDYGRVRVWGSGGFMAALLAIRLMGLVDEGSSASMSRAMVATALACVLSSLLLPRGAARSRPEEAPARGGFHFGGLFWVFLLAAATQQFGMAAYYSFFTLYMHDVLLMQQAAWVWALGAAAEMPLLFFAGRIIRRFGLRAMLMAAMAAACVRLSIYALAPAVWVILLSQALHAFTFGLFHGASIEFLRRKVPAARRGLAMAVYMSLAIGLPGWLGSSLGGEIVERWGYAALYCGYAAVPLVGLSLLVAARRRFRPVSGREQRAEAKES